MKRVLCVIFFLFSNIMLGNQIDELKTVREVEHFIKRFFPEFNKERDENFDYGNFRIEPDQIIYNNLDCQNKFDSSEIKNWGKVDINNDGLTDLFFIPHFSGYYQYFIIDKGKNAFELFLINDFNSCELSSVIKVNDQNHIKFRRARSTAMMYPGDLTVTYETDTLTYKFGTFIELNNKENIPDLQVEKIEMETTTCGGACPNFELEIKRNLKTKFYGKLYVRFVGKSESKITAKEWSEINTLINYIEVKKLKDRYVADSFDLPTINLKVTFEDGSVKVIDDYGADGTFGLRALYSKLKKIGMDTKWK
ncbi:MAG: DUF6438 domain-containing protein [Flavobacterium circumlabens]|uniref:DUF6438 domain-containing protein n=1 Tax=Flavobacterium circumlabens TaxID=2133765 RepID=UPI003267FB2B